ncbi:MAG: succinyl-diaminopimelate desuccinylase [Legionellales bacterium]|nr:succinyl-diaminopimelate desuccinylase [Legionellales bacterium]
MLDIFETLVAFDTTTPDQSGCLDWIANFLIDLDFDIEWLNAGTIRNLYATKRFGSQPICLFAGHTDTVSVGQSDHWFHNPHEMHRRDDKLIARGAVDMKGAIAAILEAYRTAVKSPACSFGILLTANEEGYANGLGTEHAVSVLKKRHEPIDWVINGEPTSQTQIGDCIKLARRGSLSAEITIHGKQGHVAYPELAINPNRHMLDFLTHCSQMPWGQSQASDSGKTSLQVVSLTSGTGFDNVIPAQATCLLNWRYTVDLNVSELTAWVEAQLNGLNIPYAIDWRHSAKPYQALPGPLLKKLTQILADKNIPSVISSSGGTSDARYLIDLTDNLVELGLIHQTAHQVNEYTTLEYLTTLSEIYSAILNQ